MKLKLFPSLLKIAGLVVPFAFSGLAVAETVTLTFNRWIPPTHFLQTEVYDPWAKDIEEASKGRIKIEFTAASLAPPNRQFDLIRQGVVDIGFSANGYTPDRFPTSNGVELPFLGNTAEAMSVAYWRTYQKYLKAADEYRGAHLLSLYTNPPNQVYSRKAPLSGLADLKGKKIRIVTDLNTKILEAFGGISVQAPSTQAYELFSSGIIDGTFLTADAVFQFNLGKFVTNELIADGGFSNTTFFLAMNPKSWARLTPQDQELLLSFTGEAFAKRIGAAWDRQNEIGKKALIAQGVETAVLSGDEIEKLKREITDPIEQAWIKTVSEKGVDGAQALKMLRDEVKAYEKK